MEDKNCKNCYFVLYKFMPGTITTTKEIFAESQEYWQCSRMTNINESTPYNHNRYFNILKDFKPCKLWTKRKSERE